MRKTTVLMKRIVVAPAGTGRERPAPIVR